VVFLETPESRTQVYLPSDGVLEVHDNVTFEANAAVDDGGAVSLPFSIGSHLHAAVSCDRVFKDRFDSLRPMTKRR